MFGEVATLGEGDRAGLPSPRSQMSYHAFKSLRHVLSYLWWPGLIVAAIIPTAVGYSMGHGQLAFNMTYICLAVVIFLLERLLPHEQAWLDHDNQMLPDLLHTLLTKGLAQLLAVVSVVFGVDLAVGDQAAGAYWPTSWHIILQVLLGLLIAEFGLYWAHRFAHEWAWLWPFHAVHHSATRLWFFNTGRFHFVDTVKSMLLGLPLLYIAGAPGVIFFWVSVMTAFIGILTHCNIEMRFGLLNYIFNTPGLHRWHHSMDLREGNKNYGENLILWDLLFGTFFDAERRPPAVIGIQEALPQSWTGQLVAPFIWRKFQQQNPGGSGLKPNYHDAPANETTTSNQTAEVESR